VGFVKKKRPPSPKPKPPAPGQATCQACGAPLWWAGTGKRPTLCPEHSPNKRRVKKGTKLVPVPTTPGRDTAADRARARAQTVEQAAEAQTAVLRLAIGLHGYPDDPRMAASEGGVLVDGKPPTDAQLADLVELAMGDRYSGFRNGDISAAARLYRMALMKMGVSLNERELSLSPNVRAQAAVGVQKVLESLGGYRKSFARVIVRRSPAE
jgi:hypothetical protein